MGHKLPGAGKLVERYRITSPGRVQVESFDPADTQGLDLGKNEAAGLLRERIATLSDLQQKLFAGNIWGLLLIFQSMDAGGKDSVIRHILSGVSPEGCQVYSFKTPSAEELNHDFLWRTAKLAPERGHIGLFSRSYYEEVLVVRVHPEMLREQRIPQELVTENIWQERLEDIAAYERYLGRNGFVVRKFFLHVSQEEQRKRFLRRIERQDKHWKFAEDDIQDRERWGAYMSAYEDAIRQTVTAQAPWYIVPADHKWFTRLAVVSAVVETLESLKLAYPRANNAKRREMRAARKLLEREEDVNRFRQSANPSAPSSAHE